jgi:hypothetical protein
MIELPVGKTKTTPVLPGSPGATRNRHPAKTLVTTQAWQAYITIADIPVIASERRASGVFLHWPIQ